MRARGLFVLAVLFAAASLAFAADSADTFHWTGQLAAGKTLTIKNLNGDVEADAAQGDQIEVTAEKRGSDAERVRVEVVPSDEGVTICALYPRGNDYAQCDAGPNFHSNGYSGHNRARVYFKIRLPRSLHLTVKNVNGNVSARGLGLSADLSTVNGSIDGTTAEWARLQTVNGSIRGRFGSANWTGRLDIATVNGRIELELPDNLSTEVEMSSVSGRLESDFPLTIQGRIGPTDVRGTIASGGRELRLRTVNGGVRLSKGGV